MKVEIWSDVMCPFCYIGKRKFEKALGQFSHKNDIEIEWKSFQLNPELKSQPGKNIHQYLAEAKGWTLEYAKEMNNYVTTMAKEEGLVYDFDKAKIANSFDAHRLSHLAKKYGKGDAVEELLFKAYFTEGKNTGDRSTLIQIGVEAGLDKIEVQKMLESNEYAEAVQRDIYEARQIGVTGVPFFVFDRKNAVSGAQPSELFLRALNASWTTFEKEKNNVNMLFSEGASCSSEEGCS
ncbi:MAG TPA: DsbA family oxidoreductase [Cytophagaceae bacterium]|jgi:predicted DsbA family dithiol-disulfide isomerase|nr:DsbA family oxidoreductase [Cytophagaceae bacterium]